MAHKELIPLCGTKQLSNTQSEQIFAASVLGTNKTPQNVIFQADLNNTGNIAIGDATNVAISGTIGSSKGIVLTPGDKIGLPVHAATQMYGIAATNDDAVQYLIIQ